MKIFTFLFCLICMPCFGADLLIMARDCASPDAYRKGDIVSVAEDGFYEKSTGYTLENGFIIRKVPGVPVADVKMYEESMTEQVVRVDPMVNVAPVNGGKTGTVLDAPVEESAPSMMTSKTIRIRKYSVPVEEVDAIISSGTNKQTVFNFQASLHPVVEKNMAVEKADIALDAEAILE